MSTRCIDISENRKFSTVSPLAMLVFVACFIVLTAVMKTGFAYFFALFVCYFLSNLFFQFTPRYIFLYMRYLSQHPVLSPSFTDKDYVADEASIKSLSNILKSN